MTSRISSAAVIVLLVTAFLVMGAADPNQDRDDSIAQLKARLIRIPINKCAEHTQRSRRI